ncbi:MAG: hypothetical protein HY711_01710 [Candidatus Melainabacteria bacterium]|nr:hypothetical protein [Candidatus Melainabacteria bacterium]
MPSNKSPLPQDEPGQSNPQPQGVGLSDLEEHISRQILRLSQEVDEGSLGFQLPEQDEEPSLGISSFAGPLETLTRLDLPFGEDSHPTLSHTNVERSYHQSAELLRNIHDLSDLLTDTVRQLGIRLNSLEEKIALTGQENQIGLSQLLAHVKNFLGETTGTTGSGKAKQTASTNKENIVLASSNADLLAELTRHVLALEARLDKDKVELRQKLEQATGSLAEQVDNKLQELESLAQQTRDYLSRHFFSLAILLVIITFIAGALVTNSLDRMATYLTQSIDALRTELGELTLPKTNSSEPRSAR